MWAISYGWANYSLQGDARLASRFLTPTFHCEQMDAFVNFSAIYLPPFHLLKDAFEHHDGFSVVSTHL